MDSMHDNSKNICVRHPKRRRALTLFCYAIAILSCYVGMMLGRLAFGLLEFGCWDALVSEFLFFGIFFGATGCYWWKLARFLKRQAAKDRKAELA
jgi:hypothetical protein